LYSSSVTNISLFCSLPVLPQFPEIWTKTSNFMRAFQCCHSFQKLEPRQPLWAFSYVATVSWILNQGVYLYEGLPMLLQFSEIWIKASTFMRAYQCCHSSQKLEPRLPLWAFSYVATVSWILNQGVYLHEGLPMLPQLPEIWTKTSKFMTAFLLQLCTTDSPLYSTTQLIYNSILWYVTPCSQLKSRHFKEELVASIFRAEK
jgi:hypothetical protein